MPNSYYRGIGRGIEGGGIEPESPNWNTGPGAFGRPTLNISGGGPQRSANWRNSNPLSEQFDTQTANWLRNLWQGRTFQFNPWAGGNPSWMPSNQPPPFSQGWGQGPTKIPTFFNPQGFPYAVPVTGDYNVIGGSRHMGQKKNK